MVECKQTRHHTARVIALICALLIGSHAMASQAVATESSTMEALKVNYLTSIYEDCRIFLEGIELFISRDYPKFWADMEMGRPIEKSEVDRYIRELKYFEGQLDALYEEFISYAGSSANRQKNGHGKTKTLEAKIHQILSFAYMRTGDFAMSYALMENKKIVSQEFTLPLMDIEGNQTSFHLTHRLKDLHSLISTNLNTVELRMKYFFPTDLEAINAYLKVESYSQLNPINLTFLSYYSDTFLELGKSKEGAIHFSEIIHFFNQMKYNNAFNHKGATGSAHVYRLPIIKGIYSMDLKDTTLLGGVAKNNSVLALERLCSYKGFARTDFRSLKGEEKQNVKSKGTAVKNFYIARVEPRPMRAPKDGSRIVYFGNIPKDGKLVEGASLRYGTYDLFEGTVFLGTIELVPCYKGEHCSKRNIDKSVTEVKVYNHELTFYEDTLDFIRMNTRMHGPTDASKRVNPSEIHIGRGCSARKG